MLSCFVPCSSSCCPPFPVLNPQAPEEPCDPHAPLQVLSNSANSLIEDGVAVSPILALRGMRVRIGMHSGVAPSEVVETARGCCEYRGAVLARAKAVCDMAGGGVTLLTEATHAAYRLGRHKLPLVRAPIWWLL